jgi:hypothetical protein
VSLNRKRDVRVLDTFDWYSPKYQSKHTYEQVFRWFEDCGLDSLRVLHTPVAVRGRKPSRVSDQEQAGTSQYARTPMLEGSKNGRGPCRKQNSELDGKLELGAGSQQL